MDAPFATPLLDLVRAGEAPRDVRLAAAQGGLSLRAHEQQGLLAVLVGDEDPEIAAAAAATLEALPAAPPGAGDVADAPDTPPDRDAESSEPQTQESALNKIAALNIAQRIALAMKGSREERAILIRDPNKIVAAAVLSSPKITDSEIEAIARMANVSEDVLRIIARTRAWMKNYAVVVALARNPKTPVALSMNLLSRLTERDLRMLSSDRNVPDVLRVTARKKIVIDK